MERSRVDKAYDHVSAMDRNYPDFPVTFSTCPTEGCNNMARGSGICADCHEKKLAEYVGAEMAKKFHEAIKARHNILHEMLDSIREL